MSQKHLQCPTFVSLSPPERYSITPLSLIFLAHSSFPPSPRCITPALHQPGFCLPPQTFQQNTLKDRGQNRHHCNRKCIFGTRSELSADIERLQIWVGWQLIWPSWQPEWLNQIPNPTILFYAMTTQTSCHRPHSRWVKFQCRITNKYPNKDNKNKQSPLGNVPKNVPASSDLMFWNIKITTNKCKKRTPTHIGLML